MFELAFTYGLLGVAAGVAATVGVQTAVRLLSPPPPDPLSLVARQLELETKHDKLDQLRNARMKRKRDNVELSIRTALDLQKQVMDEDLPDDVRAKALKRIHGLMDEDDE